MPFGSDPSSQGEEGKYNVKYISPDGRSESVYNRYHMLVTDVVNQGTYNFYHPIDDSIKHALADVVPYILFGNTFDDPTSIENRLLPWLFPYQDENNKKCD